MRSWTARIVLASIVALVASPAAAPPAKAAAKAPPAPVEPSGIAAFTRHARFVDARISPKGTYLAAVSVEGGKRSLAFVNLATRQFTWRLKPDAESMVGRFRWANDERVVVELVDQDPGLEAGLVSRGEIYAVDATGKSGRMVFGYRAGEMQTGTHIRKAERSLAWGSVLDTLRSDSRHVLVEAADWREAGDHTVFLYKLDVYTGVKNLVLQGPIPNSSFLTDESGEPRIAWAHGMDNKRRSFYRAPGEAWRELAGLSGLTPQSRPVGFVARDRTMYVVEPGPGGFGVWAVSIETGGRTLVANTGIVPPTSIIADPATERIVAVESEPDLPKNDYVDPEHPLCRAMRGLEETYPGEHVRFLNATDDGKKAVVRVFSDRNPGRFLLVDVEKLSAEPIVDVRPWIRPDDMAETSAFHINASDGFRIHGYVTVPRAPPGGAPPPLVVMPHGGPHGERDTWGFDPIVQLLAKEGFAVLRVNYRGSGGYGDAYEEAGYRKWGDRVVQDIVDATRFAIRKRLGDGGRACAFGASFGAYAAVQSAVLAPDLFRCAVGYAGIYDLARMASSGDIALTRLGRGYVRTVVGEDEGELRRASPVHNAEKVKARVLLVHGDEDRRAPIEHAERLRKALEKSGNPPAWLVEPREGHGFYDEAARERMYARVLAFVRESTAPAPAPEAP